MQRVEFQVPPERDGERLDLAIVAGAERLSRKRVRAIVDAGGAWVNGTRVRFASHAVRAGDRIQVEWDPKRLDPARASAIEFDSRAILWSGDDVLVVDKPAGMPTVATRSDDDHHVIACLRRLLRARSEPVPTLITVHRLDKETTGVLLLATTRPRATWLIEQFRERAVKKVYHAVCHGIPSRDGFELNDRLSPIDPKTGLVRVVAHGGQEASTTVRRLRSSRRLDLSLLECRPVTGRTHQIRVQLEAAGHPIVGDKRYGGSRRRPLSDELAPLAAGHHLLHARSVRFRPKPYAPLVTVTAPYPADLEAFVALAAWDPVAAPRPTRA